MHNRNENHIQRVQKGLKHKFQKRYRLTKPHSLSLAQDNRRQRAVALSDSKDNLQDQHSFALSPQKQQRRPQQLNQLEHTLHRLNFSHHEACLCGDCSCGRHLCKFSSIKPDLTKSTVYQKLFNFKRPRPAEVLKQEDVSPLRGNHLDLTSIYIRDYQQSSPDKLERPKPQDELKFDGPAPSLTTYGTLFPGHRGDNQYVKPTNKHAIGEFPLLAKTVYSTEYVVKKTSKSDYEKQHDSLKTGSDWFGATTYHKSYRQPNPENYPIRASNSEKYEKKPHFSHQFETNYRQEFTEKPSAVCPSKVQLELSQSKRAQQKQLFRENSDYKSMSPQFKAISTSKHFYV